MSVYLSSRVSLRRSLDTDVRNNQVSNGESVDTVGFEEALAIVAVGNIGSGGNLAAIVQSSPDESTWTEIAAFTAFTDTDDNSVKMGRVFLPGKDRYLRLRFTTAAAAHDCGGVILLTGAQYTTDADTMDFNA